MKPSRIAALAAALAVAALAFSSPAAAQGKGPSDAQIAGIVVAANRIDVDQGRLAQARSRSKEVQDFAKRMITDHTAVNKQASDLATRLKVKPEESDTSRALKKAAKETEGRLKRLSGAAFDKAYADNEAAYHQQVLDAIDQVLIPNARNGELKALLQKVRPAIAAHLDHAKMMVSSLGKK